MGIAFDLQPILKGTLLEVRPLRASDREPLFAVASDPLIWEQHPVRDRYKKSVFDDFFHDQLASGGGLIVIDLRTGEVIGSTRFHGYDETQGEIEIGWTFLARSHWGGTYNRELKQLMLNHAFRYVQTVVFLVSPQNIRSRRAIEKIGAIRAGSRLDGNRQESIAYTITAASASPTRHE